MNVRVPLAFFAVLSIGVAPLQAQVLPPFEIGSREAAIVDSSAQVVGEIMSVPAKAIPRSLLSDAQGLVIVPGVLKGGFVIGLERGRGVVLVRGDDRRWQLPQFVTITGGSIGWQAGLQATDLILVFKSPRSVQGLLNGKFTIGVDAAAAAGPVGRAASAGTDGQLQAEIYSYSRSRGLFAGLSLDGAKIDLNRNATEVYYRPTAAVAPGQAAPIPASALRLLQVVTQYTTPVVVAPEPGTTAVPAPAPAQQPAAVVAAPGQLTASPELQSLRLQLAAASQRLGALVAEPWRSYLALPAETYGGNRLPSRDGLAQALAKFQSVAAHPEYSALTSRPEFGETLRLLEQTVAAMPAPTLVLPPPPQ